VIYGQECPSYFLCIRKLSNLAGTSVARLIPYNPLNSKPTQIISVVICKESDKELNKMKNVFRNIASILAGVIIGMVVNMGLIIAGTRLIPLAAGIDPMNAEMWDLKYFLFPFLAHAIGTLAGAYIAARISFNHHRIYALSIGAFFLVGGTYMVFVLPAPLWFISADLILAYIPMGWLGWKLTAKKA
jgi:hypothetical protein